MKNAHCELLQKKDGLIIDPGTTYQDHIQKRSISRSETDFFPDILRYHLYHLLLQLC